MADVKKLEKCIENGGNLNTFHNEHLSLSDDEERKINGIINNFASFLKEELNVPGHSVKEVLKGNKIGVGTSVSGNVDCDLVVFFNGFKRPKNFVKRRERLLKELEVKALKWNERLRCTDETTFSLEFIFDSIKLDILPARAFATKSDALSLMNSEPELLGKLKTAQNFSSSMAQLQIEFVYDADETVKRAIRLLKYWKKGKGIEIPSYAFELMTIYVANEKKLPNETKRSLNTEILFKLVLEMLSNPHDIAIVFTKYKRNYRLIRMTRKIRGQWPPAKPYIIDPASPYMDVLSRVKQSEWNKASREAQDTLKLFK